MKRNMIIVICILIHAFAFCQKEANQSLVKKRYDSLVYLYNHEFLEPSKERSDLIKQLAVNSFEGRNSLDDRIVYLKDGITILESWDSTKLLINAYNSLARLYWLNGDPNQSINSIYKVASFAKEIEDIYWEANAYANLGVSYKMQGNVQQALSFEKKAYSLFVELKDTLQLFNINSTVAESFYQLGNYDSANWYIMQALLLFDNPDDNSRRYLNANLQGIQAKLIAREGKYDSAKSLIKESTSILKKYKSSQLDQGIAINMIELSKIFLNDSKLNEAIEFATDGYEIGIQHGLKEVIRGGAFVLAQAYEAQNQLDKSIDFYKTYYAYRDSIVNVENVKQIESLRADFEINQKQAELDVVEVRRKNQELISYIVGGILLVIAVLAMILYRNYRQKLALSNELAQINESKNKLFSIISHDLRGPMAAFSGVGFMIKSAMQADDKTFLEDVANEVDKSSKQLSNLLENLLGWAMQEQEGLSVHKEEINVKDLFSELKDTFESQAKVKSILIDVEGVKDGHVNADKNMTFTIFRNLISNALKFTPENGQIIITSSFEKTEAVITVKDTGVGMSQEKVDAIFKFDSQKSTYGTSGEKGLGLGLQLVHEFVTTNKGSIHVESKEGSGTSFVVRLPLAGE